MWPSGPLLGGGRGGLGGSRPSCCEMSVQGQSWGLEKEPGDPHSLQAWMIESEMWFHFEVGGERRSPISRRLRSEDGDMLCSEVCSFRNHLGP